MSNVTPHFAVKATEKTASALAWLPSAHIAEACALADFPAQLVGC